MTLSDLYWILMLIWAVFWLFFARPDGQPWTYRHWGGTLFQFILFFILGWRVFGPPIR